MESEVETCVFQMPPSWKPHQRTIKQISYANKADFCTWLKETSSSTRVVCVGLSQFRKLVALIVTSSLGFIPAEKEVIRRRNVFREEIKTRRGAWVGRSANTKGGRGSDLDAQVSCSVSSPSDLRWHGSEDQIVLWPQKEENKKTVWKLEEQLCDRLSESLIEFAAWRWKNKSERSAGSTTGAAGDGQVVELQLEGEDNPRDCLMVMKVHESEVQGGGQGRRKAR